MFSLTGNRLIFYIETHQLFQHCQQIFVKFLLGFVVLTELKMVKLSLAILAIVALTSTASASCYRTGNFVSCDDGSNYQQLGNTMYGNNTRTGSSWSQTQIGNSTFGSDSDGNSWSAQHYGNMSIYNDSQGNSTTCYRNGRQTTCY